MAPPLFTIIIVCRVNFLEGSVPPSVRLSYNNYCTASRGSSFFLRRLPVFEGGVFGDEVQYFHRHAFGVMVAALPLAPGLLRGSQLLGKFGLGEAQMLAQGLHFRGIPFVFRFSPGACGF